MGPSEDISTHQEYAESRAKLPHAMVLWRDVFIYLIVFRFKAIISTTSHS